MKCLILAAGYATRLYPLTENFPKPLLKVRDKTILDWVIGDVDSSGLIDEYVVVSNSRFAPHFREWARSHRCNITVLDDGTDSNETRLGAVRDIEFAVRSLNIDGDMLVMAGDNLLDFSLTEFLRYGIEKNAPCTMRYYEESREKLLKSGVVTVNGDGLITKMTEKVPDPETNWVSIAFYYFPKGTSGLVSKALSEGCKADAPGSFMAWLCRNAECYAMEMPGRRYDIGDIKSYEQVQKEYRGIVR